jgi:negative regulator of sigma E activity
MKDQDYELLSQFIDGELPAEASQELRGRLLAEPELRATYERLRKLDGRIRETFNAPGTDTVPSRVTSLLERRKNSADRKHAGWGFAVAASLLAAAGLLLSPDWRQQQTGAPSLASVLDTTPSSGAAWETLGDGRQVQPVLSFAHIDGTWCREYLLSDDGATYRGVACRNEGRRQRRRRHLHCRQGIGHRPQPRAGNSPDRPALAVSTTPPQPFGLGILQ